MVEKNIAIDGPAGAGKSTVAQLVAQQLKKTYIDTGAMYRALTFLALEQGSDLESEADLVLLLRDAVITLEQEGESQRVFANGKDVTNEIRTQLVTSHVSTVAKHPAVRQLMVRKQQELARSGNVVMDGRDIGTKVLPTAACKIFLTASVEERARRRYEQLCAKGEASSYQQIFMDIQTRDQKDRERAFSPLVQADDALLIDTTELSTSEVVARIIQYYEEKVGKDL